MLYLILLTTSHLTLRQLVSKQLVGMLVVVIVKKRLKHCFGDIITTSIGAGIMGIMVGVIRFIAVTYRGASYARHLLPSTI